MIERFSQFLSSISIHALYLGGLVFPSSDSEVIHCVTQVKSRQLIQTKYYISEEQLALSVISCGLGNVVLVLSLEV